MGWNLFFSQEDVDREMRASDLRHEQAELQGKAKASGDPNSKEWKAAEARNKEIARELRNLKKGR